MSIFSLPLPHGVSAILNSCPRSGTAVRKEENLVEKEPLNIIFFVDGVLLSGRQKNYRVRAKTNVNRPSSKFIPRKLSQLLRTGCPISRRGTLSLKNQSIICHCGSDR